MKEKMKVFTVNNGEISEGARVGTFTLRGAGVSIPAIIIGEEGRGRKQGILPVQLLSDSYREWQECGYTYIYSAQVGTTKAGRPKLYQTEDADTTEKCICIFKTKIGFRGGNSHTGDRKSEYYYPNWVWRTKVANLLGEVKEKYEEEEARKIAEELNSSAERKYPWDVIFQRRIEFHPFPGEILVKGIIAQGDAGRMGSGEQLVAILPANKVFRTGYSGRLYGAPSEHYYIYTNGQLLAATWEEREVSDIF